MNADIRSMMADPNTAIWDMLADGGINLDLVSVDPAGEWNLIDGGTRIAFGPATTETGEAADGWDWTRYERDSDGDWVIAAQDWAPADPELLAVLRAV